MNMTKNQIILTLTASAVLLSSLARDARSQAPAAAPSLASATLSIDISKPGRALPPSFYGLMTEEINHSYDGGLYAEMIQNRTFQDSRTMPVHWSLVQTGKATGSLALDQSQPLSAALPVSLRLDISRAGGRVGAANDGYWGVPVKPQTVYHASLYARAIPGFTGPLTVALENADGTHIYAQGRMSKLTSAWAKYSVTLQTGASDPAEPVLGRFTVTSDHPGTVWMNLVSLFPPTYQNHPNGFRPDLMQKMADLRPAFLRLPGGNYVEGGSIATRYDWKKTIGPLKERPGHPGTWGYRSSDGLGLLEYLEWCEELKMEPVLAVYAGYSLNGEHVEPGAALRPFVQDALDEIEYVTGRPETTWGARRAADGHPKPFPLTYVEIGNEDGFDRSGSYDARFTQFYDAIKAKYPHLKLIATAGGTDSVGGRFKVTTRTPDVYDEHYYQSAEQMERDAHRYDNYDRTKPKVYVGEWASYDKVAPWEQSAAQSGPTSSFVSALGDAAWLTGLERNSDVVVMECYAPMLVNINPGARQWAVNLIGYNALSSYGSPSYYVQVMFGQHHGDVVVPATLTGSHLYESVTRDTKTGQLYIKLVNTAETAQPVHIALTGTREISKTGTAFTLSDTNLLDINTIVQPAKVIPVTAAVTGISHDFTYTAAPYSVTVLQMQVK